MRHDERVVNVLTPCPICRATGCTDPAHKRVTLPFAGADRARRYARPEYNSAVQTKRRREMVEAYLRDHGFDLGDGTRAARCPECGRVRVRFVADHLTPLAQGGSEDGPLGVHCASCSGRQGALIANERRRK